MKKVETLQIYNGHTLIRNGSGYCQGCGTKLNKVIWSRENKYNEKTGKKYEDIKYTWNCSNWRDKK
ncbi:MAG: hypothetical protein AABY22_31500 [Nanoarchaeota archaeon]